MKRLISVLFCGLFLSISASVAGDPTGPGDFKHEHETFHPYYQELYKNGKCDCRTGSCRPTVFRIDRSIPSGVVVKIDGGWYPVPPEAMRHKNKVPQELWTRPAHVCAYPVPGIAGGKRRYIIECVVIILPM